MILAASELRGWLEQDKSALDRLVAGIATMAQRSPGQGWENLAVRLRQAGNWAERGTLLRAMPLGPPGSPGGLVTGYYEPVVAARTVRGKGFTTPLYGLPEAGLRGLTRAEIEEGGLAGRGLELFWLADPVVAFFVHIQGSATLSLEASLGAGRDVRIGVAATNDRPYLAIGKILLEAGEIPAKAMSAQAIAQWLRAHPREGEVLMRRNSRYVFFKIRESATPTGSAEIPLEPFYSVAVDAAEVPLGTPIWLDMPAIEGVMGAVRHIVLSHDTGAAIKGSGRLDLFCGTGSLAGEAAGRLVAHAKSYALVPVDGQGCALA